MKTICAWCAAEGRITRPTGRVSDGMCREHARKILAIVGVQLARDEHGVATPIPIPSPSPAAKEPHAILA